MNLIKKFYKICKRHDISIFIHNKSSEIRSRKNDIFYTRDYWTLEHIYIYIFKKLLNRVEKNNNKLSFYENDVNKNI